MINLSGERGAEDERFTNTELEGKIGVILLDTIEILLTGKFCNDALEGDNAMEIVGEVITGLLESDERGDSVLK